MKDVGWGDSLLALVLFPLLLLPVVGLVYFVMFGVLDVNGEFISSYWLSITIIATCVAEGLILVALYDDEGRAIEHGWAWLAVAAIIAAVALIPYAAGAVAQDWAIDIMLTFNAVVAQAFLIVMLSVFINARRGRPDLFDASRIETL